MRAMRIIEEARTRRFLAGMAALLGLGIAAALGAASLEARAGRWACVTAVCLAAIGQAALLGRYLVRQDALLASAVASIQSFLGGGQAAEISCREEGELNRLFHEVNGLMRVTAAQVEAARSGRARLADAIADISHQVKTPLAALHVYNGIVQGEVADPTVQRFTALTERELERIGALTDSLLRLARLDAGTETLTLREEALSECMEEVRARFAFRAEQEGKTLALAGPEGLTLRCDWSWLEEAVGNLVKNALDHTAPGQRIEVRWQRLPLAVQLAVRDEGRGIAEEDLFHIFKRFYRAPDAGETQGVGLGLPLCKAIVEAHGGTIEAESEPGQGSAFTMLFPIPTKL